MRAYLKSKGIMGKYMPFLQRGHLQDSIAFNLLLLAILFLLLVAFIPKETNSTYKYIRNNH